MLLPAVGVVVGEDRPAVIHSLDMRQTGHWHEVVHVRQMRATTTSCGCGEGRSVADTPNDAFLDTHQNSAPDTSGVDCAAAIN